MGVGAIGCCRLCHRSHFQPFPCPHPPFLPSDRCRLLEPHTKTQAYRGLLEFYGRSTCLIVLVVELFVHTPILRKPVGARCIVQAIGVMTVL